MKLYHCRSELPVFLEFPEVESLEFLSPIFGDECGMVVKLCIA